MNIKWFGQSSFLLTSKKGTKILIDPYDRFLGYKMPSLEVDIVCVTHDHRDHNKVQVAIGDYLLVNEVKEYEWQDVKIKGVKTFHDKEQGAKRGENIVFIIECDGLSICHCGDLGHQLTEEQITKIGPIDIMMIPVGGTMTINASDAAVVVQQLNPAVTIPMHYRTKAIGVAGPFLFDKVDDFLRQLPAVKTNLKELDIEKETLEDYQGVITFDYIQK
ncbi:MBL fold metallo-hydrolase [Cytobacillus sp. Hz8]|uniref:MBL fold metallo-hydrolase n=1 Tax=Cytobacillus sp. Hz8 TaxID=3347168 RepID=UPI0035E1BBA3